MLKEALENEYIPALKDIIQTLRSDAEEWKDIAMLAKTHGQPATPTRLGKEIMVFVARLEEQLRQFEGLSFPAKFGGATGNMNAHKVAYPGIDWKSFADTFVSSLGLSRSYPTTQIEHYDNLAAIFDCLRRINTILIDLCRDIWTYISMEYFRQRVVKGEVGSSAMPHKVNPIDFENAEKRSFIRYAIVATALFFILVGFVNQNNIVRWVKAGAEIKRQDKLIEKYNKEIDQMDSQIHGLTSNKDSLERYARENFGFAEPGDDVYIVE